MTVGPRYIRGLANRGRWAKKLEKKVREETNKAAVASGYDKPISDRPADIVKATVEKNVKILQRHQGIISRQVKTFEVLQTRVEKVLGVNEDGSVDEGVKLELKEVLQGAKILKDSHDALTSLIKLERQAHGIEDEDAKGDQPSGVTINIFRAKETVKDVTPEGAPIDIEEQGDDE
ncbi:hypothetical protein [Oceanidesulfovibrio marinus]|nr:hypothetical protein [Oceanidesulfovibrio marinus]